jgi:hypothetical protein
VRKQGDCQLSYNLFDLLVRGTPSLTMILMRQN